MVVVVVVVWMMFCSLRESARIALMVVEVGMTTLWLLFVMVVLLMLSDFSLPALAIIPAALPVPPLRRDGDRII